jgi:hypothetical protein
LNQPGAVAVAKRVVLVAALGAVVQIVSALQINFNPNPTRVQDVANSASKDVESFGSCLSTLALLWPSSLPHHTRPPKFQTTTITIISRARP